MPRVIWRYSSARVLTLERLIGQQFADLDLATYSAEQRRELAYRMSDAWMTMIFRHGFFHGDPHPANIMLLDDGRIGLVDFGLAGKLTDEDMTRLTRLFVDAATENVDALPRRLSELGLRYPKEREQELRDAIEELYYRYYGASVSSIDPIEVIREGLDLIYSLNLRLPTRFVILDKAIATLGAVGVELYPDFNVFEVAKPYARKLMVERFSPKRMSLRVQSEVRELASVARELPYQMRDIVEQTRQGRLEVQIRNPGIDDLTLHIDHAINRIAIALIVAGGLVGSSILGVVNAKRAAADRRQPDRVFGLRALGHLRRLADLGHRPFRPAVARSDPAVPPQELERRLLRDCVHDPALAAGRVDGGPERVQDSLLGRLHRSREESVELSIRHGSAARVRRGDGREGEEDLAAPVVGDGARPREPEAGATGEPLELGADERGVGGDDRDAAPGRRLRAGAAAAERRPDRDPRQQEVLRRAEVREHEDADRGARLRRAAARRPDPALPAERDHSRAGTDAALLDGAARRRGERAAGVGCVHLDDARLVEPAVVALPDDRDHDVVDARRGDPPRRSR